MSDDSVLDDGSTLTPKEEMKLVILEALEQAHKEKPSKPLTREQAGTKKENLYNSVLARLEQFIEISDSGIAANKEDAFNSAISSMKAIGAIQLNANNARIPKNTALDQGKLYFTQVNRFVITDNGYVLMRHLRNKRDGKPTENTPWIQRMEEEENKKDPIRLGKS